MSLLVLPLLLVMLLVSPVTGTTRSFSLQLSRPVPAAAAPALALAPLRLRNPLSFFFKRQLSPSSPASTSTSTNNSHCHSQASGSAAQKVLFVVGGPGSGKGTLCKQLAQLGHTHISAGSLLRAHISSSDHRHTRENGRGCSTNSREEDEAEKMELEEMRRAVDSGGLVRSEVMVRLLKRELARHKHRTSSSSSNSSPHYFLLDGFPRNWENVLQWQRWQQEVAQGVQGQEGGAVEVAGCVLLECSPEVMTQRCLAREREAAAGTTGKDSGSGEEGEVRRTDDRLDVILRRLDTFRCNMGRVTDHFGSASVNKLLRVNGDLPKEEVFEIVRGEISKL